jgi:hypothetical protein
MEIVEHVEAPAELVRLIKDHYETITTIKKVLLIGNDPTNLLKGKMGVFVPETRTVIIAMKTCMEDQRWVDKGMTYIANIWCNLIYTALHEGAHARQMMDSAIKFDANSDMDEVLEEVKAAWEVQREILDHAADIEAMEQMIDWFATRKNVPSLRNLGWVGQQVKILFNNLYSKAPDFINQEMEVWGAGMLALVAAQDPNLKGDIAHTNLPQAYKDTPEAVRLIEAINIGNVGMIINGKHCLRVGEALELSNNKNRS